MKATDKDNLEAIKRLLVVLLRYHEVPDESISKASGINVKTIQNQFPLGKRKRRGKNEKKKKE